MSKLGNLIRMQQHRQIGHTQFMMTGVAFKRPAVFVFATINHAKGALEQVIRNEDIPVEAVNRADMRVGKVLFRSIDILRDANYVKYWGMPIQADHFALQLLVQEEQKRLLKLVK